VQRVRVLEPEEMLFREGTPFQAPFIVTSGCLELILTMPDGRERVVAFRVPGEMVGLESWNRDVHRYSARAITQSTLCRLRWNKASSRRNAALMSSLLAKMSADAERNGIPWPGLPAIERVRAFIEDFRNRTDQPLPMTRAQIGSHLGMAEETVVRAMKTLRLRGTGRAMPD